MRHFFMRTGICIAFLFSSINTEAQDLSKTIAKSPVQAVHIDGHYQTVRGIVVDKESNTPLPGVSVRVISISPNISDITSAKGSFRFPSVPVGRHELELTFMGYTKMILPILVTSGKEVVTTIGMTEAVTDLDAVVVSTKKYPSRTNNDLASVSSRSFTVEETGRYAASFLDPARMALSFAGVSAGNDINNDIIIRGNSPKGLQWRLEGIEINNPNHFGDEGSSAGGISMISSSMLSTSDFFTGAFPAEYGNALSGVFDLQFRKGNTEKREYAFMLGVLGTEASLEGPFRKGGKSSYLVNYRYSTLSLLEKIGVAPWPDGYTPVYQDLAFNLNFPTAKAGTFSFFGLGGLSSQKHTAEKDSTLWEERPDRFDVRSSYFSGSAGLKHELPVNSKMYLKNILSYSGGKILYDEDSLTATYTPLLHTREDYDNSTFRYSGMLNYKENAKNTIRAGAIISYIDFSMYGQTYKNELRKVVEVLDEDGAALNYEAYAQWKHKFSNRLSLNTGLHANYFDLSKTLNIEPRLGLNWWMKPNQQLSFGLGLHSRLEPMAFYFAKNELPDGTLINSNSEISPSKALHVVAGYERSLPGGIRFKTEAYYQYLYNVPVSVDPGFNFSSINTGSMYTIFNRNYRGLANEGTGKNLGIEFTLERSLNSGYYFLVTSSIFDSKFRNIAGKEFNTTYNTGYIGNFVAGKEWKTGRSDQNLFGLNTKVIYTGGRRYSPIDLETSRNEGYNAVFEDRTNELRTTPYFRLDLAMSYTVNRTKLSHKFSIDIQNIMNRQNEMGKFFDTDKNQIETERLAGMVPSIYYRIEF